MDSKRSSQLSCRAFLISSCASLHASSHSCRYSLTFFLSLLRFRKAALTVGVRNIFAVFLGLVFPTCFNAASVIILLNRKILLVILSSGYNDSPPFSNLNRWVSRYGNQLDNGEWTHPYDNVDNGDAFYSLVPARTK